MSPSFRASSSKTAMNSAPIVLRLTSGSDDAFERSRNRSLASTWIRFILKASRKVATTPLDLALAQQAVVDEDARELIADGLVDQRRRPPRSRRRPRARRARGPCRPGGGCASTAVVDERAASTSRRGSRSRVEEVLEHRLALRRVRDLGMELHAEEPARRVGHGRDRAVVGGGQAVKPGGGCDARCRRGSSTP